MEAHNIVRLCQEFPGKYPAPSDFYFGEIDTVFNVFKDAEIDLTVLGVKGEIEKEDFDKRQSEQKPTQKPAYQNPLVRRDNEDDAW